LGDHLNIVLEKDISILMAVVMEKLGNGWKGSRETIWNQDHEGLGRPFLGSGGLSSPQGDDLSKGMYFI
jgi:hypothetical protein